MSSYFISLFLHIVSCIINFYEVTKEHINNTINGKLEGRVLYYAMFSKHDTELFYTCLYDHTSVWSRVQLVVKHALTYNLDYYDSMNVFKYEDVYNNIDNLTNFMIDAVVVSYVDNQQIVTRVLSYKDDVVVNTPQTSKLAFIYAILSTGHGEEHYDFTNEFNYHASDIIDSPLSVGDFLSIFNERYKKTTIPNIAITDATLKVMVDNDFVEQVFKMNDQLLL